jgi:hypothetical protein
VGAHTAAHIIWVLQSFYVSRRQFGIGQVDLIKNAIFCFATSVTEDV